MNKLVCASMHDRMCRNASVFSLVGVILDSIGGHILQNIYCTIRLLRFVIGAELRLYRYT